MKFNYDYSQTMLMKLGIGKPDNKGRCKLENTFEQALKKIKAVDELTLGAPKIIYLVGWQYQGHDDKYPAFFEVNEAAKRPQDRTALDSLLWLVEEAKKYHTAVSYHINLSDAYPDSPLWAEYLEKDLILKNALGKPKATGSWNGRTAYQVRFAEEFKTGYFQKRVDRLLELLPVQEAGTIHVDAFFVRKGKNTTIPEEKEYRQKMIAYFMDKGVDVTSEFIYRERKNGLRLHFGESDVIGLIPAFWNLRMTQKDYQRYPPQLVAGGKLNMDLQWDKDLQYLFYGNTAGEDCFNLETGWAEAFQKCFSMESVPYLYINQHKLQGITGKGKKRIAHFDGGLQTAVAGKRIYQDGKLLKENETICMPAAWKPGSWYAWSEKAVEKVVCLPFQNAAVYKLTPAGPRFLEQRPTEDGRLRFSFAGNTAYEIREGKA